MDTRKTKFVPTKTIITTSPSLTKSYFRTRFTFLKRKVRVECHTPSNSREVFFKLEVPASGLSFEQQMTLCREITGKLIQPSLVPYYELGDTKKTNFQDLIGTVLRDDKNDFTPYSGSNINCRVMGRVETLFNDVKLRARGQLYLSVPGLASCIYLNTYDHWLKNVLFIELHRRLAGLKDPFYHIEFRDDDYFERVIRYKVWWGFRDQERFAYKLLRDLSTDRVLNLYLGKEKLK